MAEIVSIDELARQVPDGVRLGVGGVHLARLPVALIKRIIEIGRKDFVFTGWGGGLALELFLEASAIRKLIFCFSSLDIFGLAPRFREALEHHTIEVEEWTALAMVQALHAAHFNLPEMPFQLPAGSDLMNAGKFWKASPSVFSVKPLGQALSMVGAAQKVLVTVEEIVGIGTLGDARGSYVLPREFVTAVAKAPWGAYPTSCLAYYTTDYSELLAYVRGEQGRRKELRSSVAATPAKIRLEKNNGARFSVTESRRDFLSTSAKIRTRDLKPDLLKKHRYRSAEATYTTDELMTVCLAREYDNASICSVGSVSPLAMVSYLLAKKTHAPHLTIIALNGGFIDIDFHPMSLTLAEPVEFGSAKAFWGGDDTYHWYYQQGRITHEVITVAQIDVGGRTNNAWIKGGEKTLRLPGQGGMADVANLHQNFLLYLTRHSRERFVAAVEFCTASRGLFTDAEREEAGLKPGKVRLVSDLGIFELDAVERIFRLASIHPTVTLENVRAQTGGDFLVAEPLPVTEPPVPGELRLIREEIDPFGIRRLEFVPGRERLSMIESILAAESGLVSELGHLASRTPESIPAQQLK